jgi:hypothetical protein
VQKLIAVAIAVMIPFLGLSGIGHAETTAELQGTIEAVDCQSGAVTLDTGGTAAVIDASDTTAVAVEDSSVPFCALEGYIGAPADAWVVPDGEQLLATQVDVVGPVAVVPAAVEAIAPLPIVGTVLGTVLYDGLLYLLVDDGGVYYRYPYYGAYYHHYFNARYRSYRGWYPASAPILDAADTITGTILGIVTVNNYQYLAVRGPDGQFRRYPYYGPYRTYYYDRYHPTTQAYTGSLASTVVRAPVAQGDPHWDAPRYTMQRLSQTIRPSASRPTPWSAPYRTATLAPAPHAQARPVNPSTRERQPQVPPTVQRPQGQPQPQARPALERSQVQPQPQARPALERPQVQPQPQARPALERPQVQPQPQARPMLQGQPQGPAPRQCDPRSQNCGQHSR